MNNKWTGLFVSLNGQMKRIGNINTATGETTLYPEGEQYIDCYDLYYVNDQGFYQSI